MSHFPSLEEFDQGQTEIIDNGSNKNDDSIDFGVPDNEDDFLAREKAILGDDVNVLGGGDGDLLNDDEAPDDSNGFAELGTNGGFSQDAPTSLDYELGEAKEPEEPEVIKEWRERRDLAIQRRDEQSEAKKASTQKAAKQALDDFYDNYNDKKEKAIAQTRAEEKEFMDSRENTVAGGTAWERIAKLVDLSEKNARTSTVDKTRFRELLISLKSDPNAPGAKGY